MGFLMGICTCLSEPKAACDKSENNVAKTVYVETVDSDEIPR